MTSRGTPADSSAAAPDAALTGRRLTLRPAAAGDTAALYPHLADRDTVRMLARIPWPVAESDLAVFLAGAAERRARGTAMEYALVPHDGDGDGENNTGAAGIVGFEFGIDGRGHLGYWLGRAYWGRGLMTEALRLSIPHVVRTRRLRRVDSGVFFDNPASLRVQEKLGFEVVGARPLFCRARGEEVRHIDTRLSRARALAAEDGA